VGDPGEPAFAGGKRLNGINDALSAAGATLAGRTGGSP